MHFPHKSSPPPCIWKILAPHCIPHFSTSSMNPFFLGILAWQPSFSTIFFLIRSLSGKRVFSSFELGYSNPYGALLSCMQTLIPIPSCLLSYGCFKVGFLGLLWICVPSMWWFLEEYFGTLWSSGK